MVARRIARLELQQLWRSPAVTAGIVLLSAACLFAVYYGATVIDAQRFAILESHALQAEQHRATLASQPPTANAGDQLFYLFFHTVHEPSEWAPIALGQRDVQPFNLKIRLLALQGQIYDSDTGNPLLFAFGNFDLAFVMVYIVPLFIVALTHNVWSSERELGTWNLIQSQPTSALSVLMVKLAVRVVVVLAPMLLVLALAASIFDLPAERRLFAVVVLTVLYVAVWTALSLIVMAWRKSSDFNLLVLLGVWLVWCVLGPALVNALAATRFPTPEELELTVRQRQGYHEAWDRPLRETMNGFYERYPEWRDVPVPGDRYSNAWYYAMQQRGDDEARPIVESYHATLEQRSRWVQAALSLSPPALLHAALTGVARTDLDSHLAYLASVADYHESLKRFFFPPIFAEAPIQDVQWGHAPRHWFRDDRPVGLLGGRPGLTFAGVAVVLAGAGAVAMWIVRRRERW